MSKEVAVITENEVAEFRLFGAGGSTDIQALVEDNLGGEQFSPNDLTRITVPAGGGTSFEVPNASGEAESLKKLAAVIVYVQKQRLYWKEAFGSGEVTPPDCVSMDLINGHGEPGGKCAECPLNEFGSGRNGEGKACTEKRNIYILTKDALLPYNLTAPVKSIENYRKYLVALTQRGVNIKDIVTVIGLEKDKNKAGIPYSKLIFEAGPALTADQKAKVEAFRLGFIPIIQSVSPSSYEVVQPEGEDANAFA